MLYRKVLIEQGKPGASGIAFDIEGMSVPNITSEVPITLNFQQNNIIGKAMIYRDGKAIYANINITTPIPKGTKLWPCAMLTANGKQAKKGVCRHSTIVGVTLASVPNSDIEIQPIEI
jgi:hypothetical protein